jgi:hypothetical protein
VPTDPCRTLGEYIEALVEELGRADAEGPARMCRVVGSRRARIVLDDESVDVHIDAGVLVVEASSTDAVDGEGTTDRGTVLDLIDGYVDVADAILDGRLDVRGSLDDVQRMFAAIEILLDASARTPGLQQLARDFRDDPCRPTRERPVRGTAPEPWYPPSPGADEMAVLERLDLLPDPPRDPP